MKILVTGGSGFVGSSIVSSLLEKGISVRVLDKVEGRLAGFRHPNLELLLGSIESLETVETAVKGAEVVYHLAESYSSEPHQAIDIDVKGNIHLLQKAAELGVKHYLFASTTRVYGKPEYTPLNEAHPCRPEISGRPIYAIAKFTNERLCLFYQREHGLPVTIFRFWWAYSSEIGGRALRNMTDAALRGEPLRVPGQSGGSFAHNDDIAQAFLLATLNSRAYGEIFNLSSGVSVTWEELAEMVCQASQSASEITLVPPESWGGDPSLGVDANIPEWWELSIEKARALLGYQPRRPEEVKGTLREALSQLVASRRK
jgi:UDP-glucose 4-epimerase